MAGRGGRVQSGFYKPPGTLSGAGGPILTNTPPPGAPPSGAPPPPPEDDEEWERPITMVSTQRKTKGKLGKDISKPVVKRKVKRSDNSMLGIAEGEKSGQYKKLEEGGPTEKLTHVRLSPPALSLSLSALVLAILFDISAPSFYLSLTLLAAPCGLRVGSLVPAG